MTATHKKIGRWHGAGLLATTLLGTSVFILPQMTIDIASSGALFAWVLLTLAIIPVTLVFARLSAHFPHAAGPAYFAEKAFGQIAGRTLGLIFLLAVPLGVPAGVLMTFQFVNALVELSPTQQWVGHLGTLLLIFVLNYRGIQISAKLQLALTILIVAVVGVLLAMLGIKGAPVQFSMFENTASISPVFVAAGLAFWSFLGVEAMAHLSEDFEDPKRDLIPAMMIGTLLVGAIYVACTYILLVFPTSSPVAMVDVFNHLVGGYGNLIIALLGIAGGIATINVYCASAARLAWSFSEDRVLPKPFKIRNSYQVPSRALSVLLSLMALVLTFTFLTGKSLEDLIFWVNGVFIIIYFVSMLSAIKLLEKKNNLLIGLSLIFCLAIMWGLGWQMWYAVALIAITSPMLWWQKNHLDNKLIQENCVS